MFCEGVDIWVCNNKMIQYSYIDQCQCLLQSLR